MLLWVSFVICKTFQWMPFALFYSDRVRSHMLTRRHVLTVAIYISLTLSLFLTLYIYIYIISLSFSLSFSLSLSLCLLFTLFLSLSPSRSSRLPCVSLSNFTQPRSHVTVYSGCVCKEPCTEAETVLAHSDFVGFADPTPCADGSVGGFSRCVRLSPRACLSSQVTVRVFGEEEL